MNILVKIKNLVKIYHTLTHEIEAIKNINLEVYQQEFISIIGPSGCGKSSLLSILGGIDNKSAGMVEKINGLKVGYMFQNDTLFEWLNILDNCLLGLKISNELTDENKIKVINLLKKYGLEDFIYSYPKELSGGMRQRTGCILCGHF